MPINWILGHKPQHVKATILVLIALIEVFLHFLDLVRTIQPFYRRTNHKTILFPQTAPTDNSRKINKLDDMEFSELAGLKEINKISEETKVDRSQTL